VNYKVTNFMCCLYYATLVKFIYLAVYFTKRSHVFKDIFRTVSIIHKIKIINLFIRPRFIVKIDKIICTFVIVFVLLSKLIC